MIPQTVEPFDLSFGPTDISKFMPDPIPTEFYKTSNSYHKLVRTWFYKGIDCRNWIAKQGINKEQALDHIQTIMASFEPSHEDKFAACAYLLSIWFNL